MSLHIIKDYTNTHSHRDAKVIDTTQKAIAIAKGEIADNLRLDNPEVITIRVISPVLFRHFQAYTEHANVSVEATTWNIK